MPSWRRASEIQAKRQRIWETYYRASAGLGAGRTDVQAAIVPAHCEQSYHMFYLLLPSLDDRQALIDHLKERQILSVFHYLPLHLSDMGRRFGGEDGDCPVTEDVSDRLVRLPFFNELSERDQMRVIAAVKEFEPQRTTQVEVPDLVTV